MKKRISKDDSEFCFREERNRQNLQLINEQKAQDRENFMNELKDYRINEEKKTFKQIVKNIGPKWYQVLSVTQRKALDTLETCIYQDILEDRCYRTAGVLKELGMEPKPNPVDLKHCVHMGKHDSKKMLSCLFFVTYGYPIEEKRPSYCVKEKIILSSILYLGFHNLLKLLKLRFKPDEPKEVEIPSVIKKKKKEESASPYLQEMKTTLYVPPKKPKSKPEPLPNLDEFNEPLEEEEPPPKPSTPPPPPPKPKKRLPRSYCDKLAGVMNIEPFSPPKTSDYSRRQSKQIGIKKQKTSKLSLINASGSDWMKSKQSKLKSVGGEKQVKIKKPKAPDTGLVNMKYTINGVFIINGKSVFVIGNVINLPPRGELIHGGHALINNIYVNIHCGFKDPPPPPKPDPCDCLQKYYNLAIGHIKGTKCYCGHHYDYGNEGVFPQDELPFFEKPTPHMPHQFHYDNIYDLDDKQLAVKKEFKRVWDTDSVLNEKIGIENDKKKKKKKPKTTGLGDNPKTEDYLNCALKRMRRLDVTAKLPDIHLVPELKEWMRRRIHGPATRREKLRMMTNSYKYWALFDNWAKKGFGHAKLPFDPQFAGETTWKNKQDLNIKFQKYALDYKLKMYRTQYHINNLFWSTMYQAQFPDKKFREIYFSYLSARNQDLYLMHPYSTQEVAERKVILMNKRYSCPPDGAKTND